MKGLRQSILLHKRYFLGYLLILIIAIIPQILFSQNELFLIVNNLNNDLSDVFFTILTYLGDGITFVVVIIVIMFSSYSRALTGLIVFLSTAIVAQVLKKVFFENHYRPFKVLSEQYTLHIPDGVTPLFNHSFPSGHTVTAFAMATFLVLIFPKRNIWLPLLLLAWLTAYSRIYLTHHFAIDVWVGSVIGTFGTLIIYVLIAAKFDHRFGEKSLLAK